MNKQELIERIEDFPCEASLVTEMIRINKNTLLGWVKELNEPEKPVVPQFVADWYKDIVSEFYVVLERLVLNYKNNTDMPICKWFFETEDALTILINMHQFGYTVEKEKRYLVKIKGIKSNECYLNCIGNERNWIISDKTEYNYIITEHTRKELEDAGFGEVFNSPLFEVEEVEE